MLISQAYASPTHSSREGAAIRLLVLHATVGSAQSALNWLCNPVSGVSTHYLIDKAGKVYQLVADDRRAHHAGVSSWQGTPDCNDYSIGVELENRNNGKDPYTTAQMQSLRELTRLLWRNHPTLRNAATHAEVALPSGRKTDPAGFDIDTYRAWVATLDPPPVATSYTEQSPILGRPIATRARFAPGPNSIYNQREADSFVDSYWNLALTVGIDPILAIAQLCHETGYLTSWWCNRPRRNPAGIGVTGETRASATQPRGEWALHPDGLWHKGVSYRTWLLDAIPDHVGRLLGYAIPAATGTPAQQQLIQRANARRIIPIRVRGSAQTIKQLGKVHNPSGLGWADPGANYGARIAQICNRLIGAV